MSGIAGIIHFDSKPASRTDILELLTKIPHRGPEGIQASTVGHVGLGHAALFVHSQERNWRQQPVWTPDQQYAITADARLYNRPQLQSTLTPQSWWSSSPSDAELILAGYIQYGPDIVLRLQGDFGFVIWDGVCKRAFAVRDPFAVKPLYYCYSREMFAFGSEAKQLFSVVGGAVPNDEVVGEYLFDNFQAIEQTFYKDIYRVPLGSWVIADQRGIRCERYWSPEAEPEINYPDDRDYLENFRELLKSAVRKRLDSDLPLGCHLSGGLDSTSIAVLADEIYRDERRDRSRFHTMSAVFPQSPDTDESFYSRATAKCLGFSHHEFSPSDSGLLQMAERQVVQNDGPWGADLQGSVLQGFAQQMGGVGARLMLTGIGGDEVVGDEFALQDLAKRHRYFRLAKEAWKLKEYSYESPLWFILRALRYGLPEWAKRAYRRLPTGQQQFPTWANAAFIEFFRALPERDYWPLHLPSLSQQVTYRRLTATWLCWNAEYYECACAYHGLEPRHPYLDDELVRFVLRIPFDRRIPRGRWKYLLRDSMQASLPPEVANRTRKTIFNAYEQHLISKYLGEINSRLFERHQWASRAFVDREEARKLITTALTQRKEWDHRQIWRVLTIELWLRELGL